MSSGAETDRVTEAWPQLYARIAPGLYLIVIVGGIFAEIFVRGRLVVHGGTAATAQNIQAHELLYRLGFEVEVFYCAGNIPLAVIFYKLFKVVSKNVALMMLFFDLVSNTIESVSILAHFAPLLLFGGGRYLSALQQNSYRLRRIYRSSCSNMGVPCYRRRVLPKVAVFRYHGLP